MIWFGELQRLLLVVRDEEAGHAEFAVELIEPAPKVLADACVQRPEGLVEQEHLGAGRQRARERDPLPLATGELVGVAVRERRQLDEFQELVDARVLRLLRLLAHRQAERHVLANRHVPEERVVLEHEPDAPVLHRAVPSAPGHPARSVLRTGSSRPAIMRRTVLLPEPDGPNSAVIGASSGGERDVLDGLEPTESLRQLLHHDRGAHVRVFLPSMRRRNASMTTSRTTDVVARVRATM